MMTRTDPLYWPCGYCGAERGQQCQTLQGRPAHFPHDDRRKSVALAIKYAGNHRRVTG